MKNLILIVILFTASVGFSQKEFQESFTRMYDVGSEKWFDCEVSVVYNFNGNGELFMFYVDNEGTLLKRTSEFIEGNIDDSYPFTIFSVKDIETGDEIVIQKFHDKQIGIRVLFEGGTIVQFTK